MQGERMAAGMCGPAWAAVRYAHMHACMAMHPPSVARLLPYSPFTPSLVYCQILVIAVLMRSVMRRSFNIYQWCVLSLPGGELYDCSVPWYSAEACRLGQHLCACPPAAAPRIRCAPLRAC